MACRSPQPLARSPCSSASSPSATSPPTPPPGGTPTEHERIKDTVDDREEGRGGRPRRLRHRRAPQPAVHRLQPDHDAGLHRRADRADHPVDRHHADHDHRPGADRRGLRQAPAPRRRPRRPDDGPRQHRPGLPVVRQGHPRGHPARRSRTTRCCAGSGARTSSTGRASSARRCRASPPRRARSTACRRSSGTARSAAPRSPSRRRTTATASSTTTSSGRPRTPRQMVDLYRRRFEHYGHGTRGHGDRRPRRAGLHAQEQPGRGQRVPALLRQRPGLRPRPVAGGLHRSRRR